MPTAIDATVGGASSNSYITLAEATTYFGDRLHVDAWTAANDTSRNQALLWATKVLNSRVSWKGARASSSQALDWPRAYVENPDFASIIDPATSLPIEELIYLPADSIPDAIKWAQCELALSLIAADPTLDPATAGFTSIGLPGISLGIDKTDKPSVLPRAVRDLVVTFGSIIDTAGGSRTVKLVRA